MSKIKMMSVLMLLLCSIGLYAQSGFDPDLPPEPPEPPAPPAAKYLLTLVGDPVSGGTLTGGGEYEAGTVVSIKATASTGYKFVNWTQNDSIVSTAASFTFTKGELAETLVAHFVYDPSTPSEPDEPDIKPVVPDPVIPEHVVTAEAIPAGGATVSVSVGSVKEGSTTVVKATVNTGYVFQGWFVADTLYTQASSFTYTMGTEDMHFVARLKYDPGTPSEPDEPEIKPVTPPEPEIPEHEVTAESIPAGGGTVSVSTNPVKEGSTTVLTVTANTGYVFQGWYVADTLYTQASSFTYTMGTADVHFEARLTFDPSTPSEPTSTGNHRYNFYLSSMRAMPGRTVTYPVYTSTTDTLRDMHFQLTFTNDLIPRFETIQLSSKAEGYTVNYSKVSSTPAPALAYSLRRAGDTDSTTTYQLDLVGGTMPPSDTRLLTFDMDINENAADTVHQVTISQISVTNTDGSTETASAHNGSLEVNEPSEAGNFYYLNVVSTGNGQTRVNSRSVRNSMYTFDLLQGSSINAYFEPDAGYHISSVMLGDVDITTQAYQDGRYLLENVNSDMDLTVTFAEGSAAFYNLTLKPIGNGVITYDDQTIRDSEQVFSVRNAAAVELTITPDANHKIGSVMLNGKTDVTADVTDGKYSISSMVAATSVTVTFEQIMHNLTLTASGNGIISYGENAVRDSSSTIQIAQGTSAEIAITPDAHNHIGQVMLNGETDITSSVTNGIYTISNMTADVAISVVYMENPHVAEVQFHQDGYRLAMTSATDGALIYYIVGNGEPNVLYTDTLNLTESCTVRATAKHEGHYEDADITTFIFNADSVTVAAPVIASNGAKVGISTTTDEAVIYYTIDGTEPTAQSTVYTDSITVERNCTVKAIAMRQNWFPSQVTSYAVDLFKVSSVTFAQNGYIISLSTPTSDATIRYTLSNSEAGEQTYSTPLTLTGNCTIEAYALRDGYNNSDTTQFVFTAANVTVAAPVIASNGEKVGISTTTEEAVIYYTIDGTEPTAESTVYTDSITVERNCTIKAIAMRKNWFSSEVTTFEFVAPIDATFDGRVLAVGGSTTMTDALESVGGRDKVAKTITAIVWNSSATLTNSDLQGLDNPNLLIYVNERSLAPQDRNNVVVNGLAMNVVLSDTGSGNCDFYAPQTFTAEMITYSREFKQATQVGVCRGWETISLPFMVQTIAHADNGVITPFGVDSSNKHFWLRQLSTNGLVSATKIEANQPYLISMPNDEKNYKKEYILKGLVTFSAQNAVVPKTEPTALALGDSSIVMVPALQSVGKSSTVWALNVGMERSQYFEGSTFERDYREVRPFEAYTIHRSDTPAPRFLPINDLMNSTTGIETISNVIMTHDNYYHLDGRKVDGKPTKKGLYITNGRKVVIK